MLTNAKNFFRRLPFYAPLRDARILAAWVVAGRPVPPPHLVKQRTLRRLAKEFRLPILVETGTYRGEMVEAMRRDFERIYSIELGRDLAEAARRRFTGDPRIEILQGDSAEVLGRLLPALDRPALFWLDSHFSDADTARSDLITPIRRELDLILARPLARRSAILIDDARLFTGRDDYPTMEALRADLARWGFSVSAVKDDIIRILPAAGGRGEA